MTRAADVLHDHVHRDSGLGQRLEDGRRHAGPVADWSGKVEEPALQTELRSLLTTAIDDLPGDYKTAFLLHDVEGLSNPEIAEALHISLPAVKSRVHRSRLFVRKQLAQYLDGAAKA